MKKSPYLRLLILLMVLFIILYSCQSVQQIAGYIEVTDGDTLKINGIHVRIIGIDTPETYAGSSKPVGEYGQEAKSFLKWFVENLTISYEVKGQDNYGRKLAYVFGNDSAGHKYLYEASVTELGYARPLIYTDVYVKAYSDQIINAYVRAYEKRQGIFSKWNSAPTINSSTSNWTNYVGKIVWLEMFVKEVKKSPGIWEINSNFAKVKIRDEEYNYLFKNYNLFNLKDKTVRFYGELWNDNGQPTIMLRAPFEIVPVN
ncbi:MAG: thermonuclease family protein [Fervidobacterium sp.]